VDNQPKKTGGIFKVLTALLSVVLAVSLVFNIVTYSRNTNLNQQVDTLTVDLSSTQEDLTTASQQIEQLTAQIATGEETITALQSEQSSLQTEYEAYQTKAAADLAAAVQQGEEDVKAAQAVADETLAALQTEYSTYQEEAKTTLAALQTEYDAYKATAEAPAAVEAVAVAEETQTPAEETIALAADDVVATVNGAAITGANVMSSYQSLVNYYGEPDAESLELYYAVAMDQEVTLKLVELTAAEMGLDQFTQEELDALYATSDAEWQSALDSYVSNNLALTDTATEEEKTAAYAQAESYYNSLGYTPDILRETYRQNEVYTRVTDELCKDVTVTDDEVLAYFNDLVTSDQALYQYDAEAYETQLMMVQYGYADQDPLYHPEGYRYIKHILLTVDSDLLTTYTTLLASFNAQTDETAEADRVSAEAVEAAKQAVLASVQPEIDEINLKLAQGVSFEDLIAQYGADSSMTTDEYASGYEVSTASSSFVPEFVTAAFSVNNIGDISEPAISEYGVHIVKYVGDVPGGPVSLTDDMKASISATLKDEKDSVVLSAWRDAADIQYTGILRTYDEVTADTAQ
jgi:hypothetical protein